LPTAEDSPKLTWPPTKEDLQRLYVEQRLSAAKIAKVYGHETGNPRSGAELIRHYLKKYGIERRNRVAELAKDTEDMVTTWKQKHPKQKNPDMEEEKSAVLELIRNEGLSIEHLDEETRGRIRAVMEYLHWVREVSMTDIAELIGSKTSGYVSWLFKKIEVKARDFEEGRLKGIADARKHKRNPFEGTDEDKAYILGLKHGDLYAYSPFGDAVRVSTSTTHPALANLFTELFSRYGHVYIHPRYKKDTRTYEWNLQVILDNSFAFLLESRDQCREWIAEKESTMLAYLAGLVDAEGNIRIYPNPRTVGIVVSIWNTDTNLVTFAYTCLAQLGFRPMKPYLHRKAGGVSTGFHLEMKKDYWRVMVGRFEEAQLLVRRLPLRHKEKVEMKEVVLSIAKGDLYNKVAERISCLKGTFKSQTASFTRQAEIEFLARHKEEANESQQKPAVAVDGRLRFAML